MGIWRNLKQSELCVNSRDPYITKTPWLSSVSRCTAQNEAHCPDIIWRIHRGAWALRNLAKSWNRNASERLCKKRRIMEDCSKSQINYELRQFFVPLQLLPPKFFGLLLCWASCWDQTGCKAVSHLWLLLGPLGYYTGSCWTWISCSASLAFVEFWSIVNDSMTLVLTLKLFPWKCEKRHKQICHMPLKAESCPHEALQWHLVLCARRLCKASMQGV